MTAHGSVRPVAELEQRPDHRRDLVSLMIVEGVRYMPRRSWEVEAVSEVALEALPADMAPIARTWLVAVLPKL